MHFLNKIQRSQYGVLLLVILASFLTIWGCGAGGDAPAPTTSTTTTTTTTTTASNTIVLSLSQNSVKTDGSDSSTVTATVIQNNIPQEGVTVTFATTAGLISSGSGVSDSNGEATVNFYANPGDKSNQIATVTATSGGLSQTIPISITGTTITLAAGQTSLSSGGITTLIITLADAGGAGIHGATVSLSASNGNVALSATTGTTSFGSLSVTLNGIGITLDSTVITVTGAGATKNITIAMIAASSSINITSPATSPYTIVTGVGQLVTITGPNNTSVTFVSSLGTWDGGAATEVQVTDGTGNASRTLTSTAVGTATVQVYVTADTGNSDNTLINVSPPNTAANQVAVSFSATTIPPSDASITNSVTVYAKVITASSEPIANVPVTFSLSNTTGGGEYVSPASAITDSSGYATTTFYSGTSSSSGLGVNVIATEHGSASPGNSDSARIIIGGNPASISLSRSTHATAGGSNTFYILPMSVLVVDSGGAAVNNATVSLTSWPSRYSLGSVAEGPYQQAVPNGATILAYDPDLLPGPDGPLAAGAYAGISFVPNEDKNRNLVLDPGEDFGPCDDPSSCTDLVPDGSLTPPSSSSGSVPSSVTTIENGTGTFNLTYLKSSAVWIESEITASVKVLGTESQTTLTLWLPHLVSDAPYLDPSPYGHYSPLQCADGIDNDGDTLIDFNGGDPECASGLDNDESS